MKSSTPRTRYARNGDARIAYQVIGEGPFDLIAVPGFVSNVEYLWEIPGVSAILERFASYARLITWDKRHRVVGSATASTAAGRADGRHAGGPRFRPVRAGGSVWRV